MKRYAFDVVVNGKPYTCELNMEAGDVWDAEEQLRETVCNPFSRDADDEKEIFRQAARQFREEFRSALNMARIEDVRPA